MRAHANYAFLLMPVALQFILAPSASTRKCGSIYKGFAQCLLALGDSMADNVQKDEGTQEIDTVCRSWDEFHMCANAALAGCPDQAAAVWESLRQESRKMQFSGNLYDMCSTRAQALPSPLNPLDESNQESLKATAFPLAPSHFMLLFVGSLLHRI